LTAPYRFQLPGRPGFGRHSFAMCITVRKMFGDAG
jgi:hypothetical protein